MYFLRGGNSYSIPLMKGLGGGGVIGLIGMWVILWVMTGGGFEGTVRAYPVTYNNRRWV